MTSLAKVLIALALIAPPSAHATYDFTMKDIEVEVLSADGLPLPCARVTITLQALEFRGYEKCGWIIPQVCARHRRIGLFGGDRFSHESTYRTARVDENGIVRFPGVKARWLLPTRHDVAMELHAWLVTNCTFVYRGSRAITKAPARFECRSEMTRDEWIDRYPNICY